MGAGRAQCADLPAVGLMELRATKRWGQINRAPDVKTLQHTIRATLIQASSKYTYTHIHTLRYVFFLTHFYVSQKGRKASNSLNQKKKRKRKEKQPKKASLNILLPKHSCKLANANAGAVTVPNPPTPPNDSFTVRYLHPHLPTRLCRLDRPSNARWGCSSV